MNVTFLNGIIHFINFTIIASIVYLFNNIKDYRSDQNNKKLKYDIDLKKIKNYYYFGIIILSIQLIIVQITYMYIQQLLDNLMKIVLKE